MYSWVFTLAGYMIILLEILLFLLLQEYVLLLGLIILDLGMKVKLLTTVEFMINLEDVQGKTGGKYVVDAAFMKKRCPILVKSNQKIRTRNGNLEPSHIVMINC